MVAIVPVLFAILGLLIYAFAATGDARGKLAEIGKIIFATAFLACMLAAAQHAIKLM